MSAKSLSELEVLNAQRELLQLLKKEVPDDNKSGKK